MWQVTANSKIHNPQQVLCLCSLESIPFLGTFASTCGSVSVVVVLIGFGHVVLPGQAGQEIGNTHWLFIPYRLTRHECWHYFWRSWSSWTLDPSLQEIVFLHFLKWVTADHHQSFPWGKHHYLFVLTVQGLRLLRASAMAMARVSPWDACSSPCHGSTDLNILQRHGSHDGWDDSWSCLSLSLSLSIALAELLHMCMYTYIYIYIYIPLKTKLECGFGFAWWWPVWPPPPRQSHSNWGNTCKYAETQLECGAKIGKKM